LHGATLEARWLEAVRWLCEEILSRFWDEGAGTVFDTPDDGEDLVLRPRDAMDNATPSGPSLAAELLSRAGHVFGEERYARAAAGIAKHEYGSMSKYPTAYGRMLSVVDRAMAEPIEIAVLGRAADPATRGLLQDAHAHLLRNGTNVGRLEGESIVDEPLQADRDLVGGAPTAYACRGYACRLPVTAPDDLAAEIDLVVAP
jgi:uncharacterized protein YyaL (SSP411 family)